MKRLFIVTGLVLATIAGSYGQSKDKEMKSKKLTKEESASLTPEQRLVHETDRKTKRKKEQKTVNQEKGKNSKKTGQGCLPYQAAQNSTSIQTKINTAGLPIHRKLKQVGEQS